MLNLQFAYTQIVYFSFFSPLPQATPCCPEITVVQLNLGDGKVMERGKVRETERQISYSTVSILMVIMYIVLYWLTCIVPI